MKDHHLQIGLEQMSSDDDRIFIQAFAVGFLPHQEAQNLLRDWKEIMDKYKEHWRYDTISSKIIK